MEFGISCFDNKETCHDCHTDNTNESKNKTSYASSYIIDFLLISSNCFFFQCYLTLLRFHLGRKFSFPICGSFQCFNWFDVVENLKHLLIYLKSFLGVEQPVNGFWSLNFPKPDVCFSVVAISEKRLLLLHLLQRDTLVFLNLEEVFTIVVQSLNVLQIRVGEGYIFDQSVCIFSFILVWWKSKEIIGSIFAFLGTLKHQFITWTQIRDTLNISFLFFFQSSYIMGNCLQIIIRFVWLHLFCGSLWSCVDVRNK